MIVKVLMIHTILTISLSLKLVLVNTDFLLIYNLNFIIETATRFNLAINHFLEHVVFPIIVFFSNEFSKKLIGLACLNARITAAKCIDSNLICTKYCTIYTVRASISSRHCCKSIKLSFWSTRLFISTCAIFICKILLFFFIRYQEVVTCRISTSVPEMKLSVSSS